GAKGRVFSLPSRQDGLNTPQESRCPEIGPPAGGLFRVLHRCLQCRLVGCKGQVQVNRGREPACNITDHINPGRIRTNCDQVSVVMVSNGTFWEVATRNTL